jgi:hypothetical protein
VDENWRQLAIALRIAPNLRRLGVPNPVELVGEKGPGMLGRRHQEVRQVRRQPGQRIQDRQVRPGQPNARHRDPTPVQLPAFASGKHTNPASTPTQCTSSSIGDQANRTLARSETPNTSSIIPRLQRHVRKRRGS